MPSKIDKLIYHPPPLGTRLYLPGLPGWGSKIYDRSPYGNHGTITGAVWKYNGRIWYLYFDGADDYVDLGDNAAFELNTFTILAWVKRTSIDALACIASLQLQSAGAGGVCGVMFRFNADNTLNGYVCIANAFEVLTTVATYGTGWMLVGLTKTGTAVEITVNGVSAKTGTLTSATIDYSTTSTKKTLIGAIWNGSTTAYENKFIGGIPLPRVLNVAKTAPQILSIYNQERKFFGV